MKRMRSKLTNAFVVLLLFAVAATTAKSQQPTYQILCRGISGGVYFKHIDSRTTTTGERIVTYELVFTPSQRITHSMRRNDEH